MIYTETPLAGAYIIELVPHTDERGFFARAFSAHEFHHWQIDFSIAQANISYNRLKGTLRGMHFALPPTEETKMVRCISGAIFDVIIDLRPDSPTYLQHFCIELTAENRKALYVPTHFAHGFQSLVDDTEVLYFMGEAYKPGTGYGLRYDDPTLNITWPLPITVISERDQQWPLYASEHSLNGAG